MSLVLCLDTAPGSNDKDDQNRCVATITELTMNKCHAIVS